MRLADLYDRLADRAETRSSRAVPLDEIKEGTGLRCFAST
jgi:hypothetical protein